MVTDTLPKGIKRPKRGAYHSSRPTAEVKNFKAIKLPTSSVQIGSEPNTDTYKTATGAILMGIKRPKGGADHSPGPSNVVKNTRTIYLQYSSGEIGFGANTSLYQWYRGSSQRDKAANAKR
jgi:hypothetical protein